MSYKVFTGSPPAAFVRNMSRVTPVPANIPVATTVANSIDNTLLVNVFFPFFSIRSFFIITPPFMFTKLEQLVIFCISLFPKSVCSPHRILYQPTLFYHKLQFKSMASLILYAFFIFFSLNKKQHLFFFRCAAFAYVIISLFLVYYSRCAFSLSRRFTIINALLSFLTILLL